MKMHWKNMCTKCLTKWLYGEMDPLFIKFRSSGIDGLQELFTWVVKKSRFENDTLEPFSYGWISTFLDNFLV